MASTAKINVKTAEGWQTQIGELQAALTDNLRTYLTNFNSIASSFEGDAADGVIDSFQEFIRIAASYSDGLNSLKTILANIVTTMKNQ